MHPSTYFHTHRNPHPIPRCRDGRSSDQRLTCTRSATSCAVVTVWFLWKGKKSRIGGGWAAGLMMVSTQCFISTTGIASSRTEKTYISVDAQCLFLSSTHPGWPVRTTPAKFYISLHEFFYDLTRSRHIYDQRHLASFQRSNA